MNREEIKKKTLFNKKKQPSTMSHARRGGDGGRFGGRSFGHRGGNIGGFGRRTFHGTFPQRDVFIGRGYYPSYYPGFYPNYYPNYYPDPYPIYSPIDYSPRMNVYGQVCPPTTTHPTPTSTECVPDAGTYAAQAFRGPVWW